MAAWAWSGEPDEEGLRYNTCFRVVDFSRVMAVWGDALMVLNRRAECRQLISDAYVAWSRVAEIWEVST